jgi:ribose/xylose/arabinose/galactoside ABC-type transport system permease subunit
LGDLFNALVSMSRTRSVSAMSGDQLKLNAILMEMIEGCAFALARIMQPWNL